MTLPSIIGEARAHLDDAHHWARAAASTPTVTAKPGGVEREWDCADEARKRLIAARNRIDQALADLGGAR